MRMALIGSEDTEINKQGWTSVMQARHRGHTCMNTEVSSCTRGASLASPCSLAPLLHLLHPVHLLLYPVHLLHPVLNFAPEVLHPIPSPINKMSYLPSRIFQSSQTNMNKKNRNTKSSIACAMLKL